jgi:hypothetical protein
MSIKALNWAFEQNLKPAQKMVLVALADHASDDGLCWPGIKTIAKKASMSESSIRRQLDQLIDAGFLHKEIRIRENGSQQSNAYYLNMGGCQNDRGGLSTVTPLEPPLEIKKKKKEPKQAIEDDFKLTPETVKWFAENRPDINIEDFTQEFILACQAHDYRYARPQQAIRNWAQKRKAPHNVQRLRPEKPSLEEIHDTFAEAARIARAAD